MEVLGQWRHGIVYPRWSSLSHFGYGEPTFLFYPPISWMLGAVLGWFLPWTLVTGAFVWIVLSLAGFSMFLLAREWLGRNEAIFAAVFYVANPYFIVIVYWRSAFAELAAGVLIPLLVLVIVRSQNEAYKATVPLALIVAAGWLTNAPSAVMVNYSLFLLLLVIAGFRRSPKILFAGIAGIVLGALLAGFYLFPAYYEQRWVNIAQAVSEGLRPQDNFLFAKTTDPDHNIFNHLISVIALSEIIALIIAGFFSSKFRKTWPVVFSALAIWGGVMSLSMMSGTNIFWNHLPELRFMQFPWRWLLCLNVPLALFVTSAWKRWSPRAFLFLALLCFIAYEWHTVLPPWWNKTADIVEMQDNQLSGQGDEGTDEYVPLSGDAYELKQDAPKVRYSGLGSAQVDIHDWRDESRSFTAVTTQPGQLILRLFNYPAWKVMVNENVIHAGTDAITAQMIIPVQAGINHIQIRFIRTWDRTAGGISSAIAAIFILGMAIWQRKKYSVARNSQLNAAQ